MKKGIIRAASVLCAVLFAAAFAGCSIGGRKPGSGEGEIIRPGADPTRAPSASHAPAPEKTVYLAHADLDSDGEQETIELDTAALIKNGSAAPVVVTADGKELPLDTMTLSGEGAISYAIADIGGQDTLFEYAPVLSEGSLTIAYKLIRLKDGALEVTEEAGTVITSGEGFDAASAASVTARVNEIWEKSFLLFSTDKEVVMRDGLREASGAEASMRLNLKDKDIVICDLSRNAASDERENVVVLHSKLTYTESFSSLFGSEEGFEKVKGDLPALIEFIKALG